MPVETGAARMASLRIVIDMKKINTIQIAFVMSALMVVSSKAFSQADNDSSNEVLFEHEYLHGDRSVSEINKLWEKTDQIGKDYKQNLDDASPFNGLYARGEGWQSLENDAYEYKYGIDLEFYANGRYEARRRIEKKKLESEVQNLQLLNDMQLRSADEAHHRLRLIAERVKQQSGKAYLSLLESQLELARHEFENGLMSKNEFNGYVSRHFEAQIISEKYATPLKTAIPESWFYLLNDAEHLKLIDEVSLNKLTKQRSYSLKLQDLFKKRATFHETWRDDLSLRVYLERRYNDYNKRHDTVAGVRVRLPLDKPENRDDMVELEQEVYQYQLEALEMRYKQRIKDNLVFFATQQGILQKMKDEYKTVLEKIANNTEHSLQVLPSLPYTPDKDNRVFIREKYSLRQDILLQRIKVIEILFVLSNLTQSNQPEAILQTPPPEIISRKLVH